MKTQNPFDRFKKNNYIPRSAFPARKMVRTSLPIGRVVPLYECAMNPGDHIKVPVAQLSRFMEMSRPVMQNFKVSFGAFYVPFVAFDRFFHFHKELRPEYGASATDASVRETAQRKLALNARDFFNAATPESMKNHPIMVDAIDLYGLPKLEGSLIDHLGYRIFNEKQQDFRTVTFLSQSTSNVYPSDLVSNAKYAAFETNSKGVEVPQDRKNISITPHAGGSATQLNPPIVYALLAALYYNGLYESANGKDFLTPSTTATYSVLRSPSASWLDLYASVYKYMVGQKLHYKATVGGTEVTLEQEPTMTPYQLWGMSLEKFLTGLAQLYSQVNLNSFRGFTANTVSYLAYMSIYSDWFLPETFVDCDDFRADIASAYYNYGQNAVRLINVFDNAWTTGDTLAGRNPYMDFYRPYLEKFECLPVLKSLDRITGARRNDYAELTPMADTIEENFAQRMLAKFRDLVNRIGLDYRDNFQSVYGTRPKDDTLLRSQVIGFRDFDVLVGDVQQTGSTTDSGNFGSFGGYAVSRDSMKPFEWTAQEHGVVMVLCWVRPTNVAYGSLIDRSKLKSKYEDYLIPEFGGVGYQQISFKEVDGNGNTEHDNSVFGYEERYAEYMFMNNEVSGQMRSIYKDWHSDLLDFEADQSLTTKMDYLYWTDKDNVNRIFVDTTNDPVIISAFFDGSVTRALPRNIRTDF